MTDAEILRAAAEIMLRDFYSPGCTEDTYEPECVSCKARVVAAELRECADIIDDLD